MMLALLLAQLVQPWPGLDSPLVQPGPTICVGECAGPVVWGPAERGRLVVACDMRSDTCSDGRTITTVRASPVPCETSPGVWEMAPENTGCYSVRGLESWAATTSYLSWGAELDQWSAEAGLVVTETPDRQGWRLTNSTGDSLARLTQAIAQATPGEERALTCYARAVSVSAMTILRDWSLGRNQVPLQTHWSQVANVGLAVAGGFGVMLAPWPRDLQGAAVDVAGCWLAKATTPGRACWGGEAPVTCAADRHTISTEGWPTEEGEVCITSENSGSGTTVLIEGRPASGSGVGTFLHISGTRYRVDVGEANMVTSPGVVVVGRPVHICFGRRAGNGYISVDGVRHEGGPIPPFEWEPVASIGRGRVSVYQGINGSISSLRVRSFE